MRVRLAGDRGIGKSRKLRSLRNVWCSRAHRPAGDRGIRRGSGLAKGMALIDGRMTRMG